MDDALAIQNEIPGVLAVSPEVRNGAQITAGENNWSTQVMGEGVDYLTIRAWALEKGEMFNETDVRSAAKVCVLGKTTADTLFPDDDEANVGLLRPQAFDGRERLGVPFSGFDRSDHEERRPGGHLAENLV